MVEQSKGAFWIRVGLTVCVLEFFGPLLRDFSASHALNPTWVGHARVHLVWLLGFMFFSGIANLYLIWFRRTADANGLGNLWLSAAWQGCNLAGFWAAYFLAPDRVVGESEGCGDLDEIDRVGETLVGVRLCHRPPLHLIGPQERFGAASTEHGG